MTGFLALIAVGLLSGLLLGLLAGKGRRMRLERELKVAQAELERLGYIEAALRSYPFGEGIPQVAVAMTSAMAMCAVARRRVADCIKALGL